MYDLDKTVLLQLDNHESNKYYATLEQEGKNNVVTVSLAPYTSHKPMEIVVYGPLKRYFEREVNIFQMTHPGRIKNE